MTEDLMEIHEQADGDSSSISKHTRPKDIREWSAAGMISGASGNDYACMVALLERLNKAIDTLMKLADDYYTHFIFNSSTRQDKQLEDAGFNEDWFIETADKLEQLRTILYGNNLDWDEILRRMKEDLLGYEAYWGKWYENQFERYARDNHKLKEKIFKLTGEREK